MVTTIQLDENIKEKLDKLKIHHRETYNELIARLIVKSSANPVPEKESLMETIETLSDPETMRDIAKSLEEYEKGEFFDFEKIKKDLKLNV